MFKYSILCLIALASLNLVSLKVSSQNLDLKFEHITIEQGLSHNSVSRIFQDSQGFIWFATEDGLDRFDGYSFKVYKNMPNDKNSVADNFVADIYEDEDHNFWLANDSRGLDFWNRKTGQFKHYVHDSKNPNSLSNNDTRCIMLDNKKRFWIGTFSGLELLDRKRGQFIHVNALTGKPIGEVIQNMVEDKDYNLWFCTNRGLALLKPSAVDKFDFEIFTNQASNQNSLPSNDIISIFCDKQNKLWIGTASGLCTFDRKHNNFIRIKSNQDLVTDSILSMGIKSFAEDRNGRIWIGTVKGLVVYNPTTNTFSRFENDPNEKKSLSNRVVMSVLQDKTGTVWVGTKFGGINKVKATKEFKTYMKGLPIGAIIKLRNESPNYVWVGTVEKGLVRLDKKTGKIENLDPLFHGELKNKSITTLFQDSQDNLWIGQWEGPIYCVKFKKNQKAADQKAEIAEIKKYLGNYGKQNGVNDKTIQCIFEDSKHRFWFCGGDNGITIYNPRTEKYSYLTPGNSIKNITDGRIQGAILEDKNGFVWVGTFGGLNRIHISSGSDDILSENIIVKQYKHQITDSLTICDDRDISMVIDSHQQIWLGTYGGGFNKIELDSKSNIKSIQHFDEASGLPNNAIYRMYVDKKGFVWASTNKGLSRFDPKMNLFKNYDYTDGLQSNQFFWRSGYQAPDDEVYFGGINGLNGFYPDSIADDKIPPLVVLTDFKIGDQSVKASNEIGAVLKAPIGLTHSIKISYKVKEFSFEFAALHFAEPERNLYAYKMEGFDNKWYYSNSKKRFASYTNLAPGKYTFRVKASNADEVWNEEGIKLEIEIVPPFWKSWWFRTFGAILVLTIVYLIYLARVKQIKQRNKELERLVEIRTAEISEKNVILLNQKEEITQQADELAETNKELEKLSIVAAQTDNAVLILDARGKLEWTNEAFTRLYGYTQEHYIDEFGADILENYGLKKEQFNKLNQKELANNSYEIYKPTKNKGNIWVQVTFTPIIDENEQITKFIAIESNINQIKEAENEIRQKNIEILSQKEIVESKNQQIESSIRYAYTMQQAILPSKAAFDALFAESFVIYKPKDIVSGDFYWLSSPNKHPITDLNQTEKHRSFTYLAVADCTGHGVPGAFMVMIGNRLLSELINEEQNHSPASILSQLDKRIRQTLKQDVSENNDGMDICLCRFEQLNDTDIKLTYSGANSRFIYYSKANETHQMVRTQHKYIGGRVLKSRSQAHEFEDKEIQLQKGDFIYLFTDGIEDQNNIERKPIGSLKLYETISGLIAQPISEQQQQLVNLFESWKAGASQRDDVTIVGVKI